VLNSITGKSEWVIAVSLPIAILLQFSAAQQAQVKGDSDSFILLERSSAGTIVTLK